jgi:aspartyl-tRNA(Asn)/glutamyl-tRNA(Gln) amidotransferase subunit B
VIIKDKGLEQISDKSVIQGMVQEVFEDNPHVLEAIKSGQEKQRGFIVGQVMKKSGGKAAPEVVQAVISEAIG